MEARTRDDRNFMLQSSLFLAVLCRAGDAIREWSCNERKRDVGMWGARGEGEEKRSEPHA